MAFYGAKFLKYTLAVLAYIVVCGIVMILPYNFGFISLQSYSVSQNNSAVIGWIAGTFIVGSFIGVLVAYYLSKFMDKYGTTLLGSMTGVIVTLLLISPFVKNQYVEFALIVVLALLGGYTGYKLNREV